ncbi:MAG: purine-nucleoside phosphorylase [Arcanobacterium sp.]|nr:purine-nucleoside phosphorylase [Arcanobacterium sp.]
MEQAQIREHLFTAEIQSAAQQLAAISDKPLKNLVVLGSGLVGALDEWGLPEITGKLSDFTGVLAPVADGHLDRFAVFGNTLVTYGRTHLYEGHGPDAVTVFPKIAAAAGINRAVLCNANGCLRDWNLGDVMLISDHANFTAISPFSGPVFTDIWTTWSSRLREAAQPYVQRVGTYGILRGPEFQTQLESNILRNAGIDCVGMSTVMEALTLHALEVEVAGLSVVSDLSFDDVPTDPTLVVETAAKANTTLRKAIEAILAV